MKIKTVINHWNTLWELFRSTSKPVARINSSNSRINSKIVTSLCIYISFCLLIYHWTWLERWTPSPNTIIQVVPTDQSNVFYFRRTGHALCFFKTVVLVCQLDAQILYTFTLFSPSWPTPWAAKTGYGCACPGTSRHNLLNMTLYVARHINATAFSRYSACHVRGAEHLARHPVRCMHGGGHGLRKLTSVGDSNDRSRNTSHRPWGLQLFRRTCALVGHGFEPNSVTEPRSVWMYLPNSRSRVMV